MEELHLLEKVAASWDMTVSCHFIVTDTQYLTWQFKGGEVSRDFKP